MKTGNRGMGISKHRKSGRAGVNPKERLAKKLEAEKQERKKRKSNMVSSIKELFNSST